VIEEALKNQLEEKQCLETEIVSLRKEAEKREEILTRHLKERSEDLNKLEANLVNKKEYLRKKSSP
jgi:hypothetical protein